MDLWGIKKYNFIKCTSKVSLTLLYFWTFSSFNFNASQVLIYWMWIWNVLRPCTVACRKDIMYMIYLYRNTVEWN